MGEYGTFSLKLYLPLENYLQPGVLERYESCTRCSKCCRKFDSLREGPIAVAELLHIVYGTEVPLSDSEYYQFGWRNPSDIGDEAVRHTTGYSYCAIRIKSPAVRFTDEEYKKVIARAKRMYGIIPPETYHTWEVTLTCLVTKPKVEWETRTVSVEGRSICQATANAKNLLANNPDCAYATVVKTVQNDDVQLRQVFETKCADCKRCECNNGIYFCKRFGVNVEEHESCQEGKKNS